MKTDSRAVTALSMAVNAGIVYIEIRAISQAFLMESWTILNYYTVDSNILTAIVCLLISLAQIVCFFSHHELPGILQTLKYAAAVCLALTSVIVFAVLIPLTGNAAMMTQGTNFYHHIICPALTILSFLLLESRRQLPHSVIILPIALTLCYGVPILLMNIERRLVGPYPFLHVYEQSLQTTVIWCVVILLATYIAARIIYALHRAMAGFHAQKGKRQDG